MAGKKKVVKDGIEEKIVKTLASGPQSSKELAAAVSTGDKELSSTLQRLKRQGKLKIVNRRRWALSSVGVCPECEGKGWVTADES